MNDILSVKFPINNTEFNCMIIDANLGIKDNLRNIFFLEFDLSSTIGKEPNKVLRDINNENVEREIFFVLNGTIHNVPLFAMDLKFSVEMRKFIKCVQSRLEMYKNKLTQLFKTNPNEQISLRNNFFSKVLSNTNLGIEFNKPYYDQQQPHNFMTNFNSVVNSNITLNKIYLEVTIPKKFINQSFTNLSTINKAITNKNEITGVNELKLDKFGITRKTTNSSSNNNTSNSNNKNNILPKSSSSICNATSRRASSTTALISASWPDLLFIKYSLFNNSILISTLFDLEVGVHNLLHIALEDARQRLLKFLLSHSMHEQI